MNEGPIITNGVNDKPAIGQLVTRNGNIILIQSDSAYDVLAAVTEYMRYRPDFAALGEGGHFEVSGYVQVGLGNMPTYAYNPAGDVVNSATAQMNAALASEWNQELQVVMGIVNTILQKQKAKQ